MCGAVSTAQGTAAAVASAGTKIEGIGRGLQGFAGQVAGAVAAMTAGWVGGQTFGVLEKWFGMFSSQQETFIRLEATLRSQGVAVDETVAKYREFAAQVAATTTTSSSATLALLTQAATFRAVGDAGIVATRDALALAAATGVSAQAVLRLTAAEAQGDTQRAMHMARVLPQLRFIKDQATFQREYNKLVSAGTEAQQKLADTAAGQLARLGNLWSSVQKQLGSVVADGLKPLAELAREAAGAFGTLSQSAREAIVVILAVTAAGVVGLAALATGVLVLGGIFNLSFGGAGVIIGAVVLGLAAVAGGAVALVQDLGGVKATFEAVKKAAEDAWAWLRPVRVALADLWSTLLGLGKQAWEAVKQAAVNAWAAIVSGSTVTWDQVRSGAVDAIIAVEFGLTHMQQVWDLAWAGLKYAAVVALNSVLEYVLLPLTGPFLLAAWAASLVNWQKFFTGVWEAARDTFVNAAHAASDFFSDVTAAIRGETVNWKRWFGDGLFNNFKLGVEFTATGVVSPELKKMEAQLKAEFEALKGSVGESFDVFRARKLAEFAATVGKVPTPKVDPKAPPASWAPQIAAAKAELTKFNAVLAGTADDLSLLADYRDALRAGGVLAHAGGGAAAMPAVGPDDFGADFAGGIPVVAVSPSLPGDGRSGEAVPLLKQIRDAVVRQAGKPGLDVQAGMGLA